MCQVVTLVLNVFDLRHRSGNIIVLIEKLGEHLRTSGEVVRHFDEHVKELHLARDHAHHARSLFLTKTSSAADCYRKVKYRTRRGTGTSTADAQARTRETSP